MKYTAKIALGRNVPILIYETSHDAEVILLGIAFLKGSRSWFAAAPCWIVHLDYAAELIVPDNCRKF
jgi:hypothetical protein